MLYRTIDIAPSSIRASLRAIASGKKPRLAPALIADLVLGGALDETQPTAAPSDDFVPFASRMYALEDTRG
jgi:hypothetical protein